MADDADEEGRQNWRDPRRYESMLALDRRAGQSNAYLVTGTS